jgi:S-adenosylmethionine hydrolase
VTWIDRYGNVQLDLLPSDLDEIGVDATGLVQVSLASDPDTGSVLARRVWAFSDLRVGEFGLLVDGNGRVALVLDRASAASRLIGTGARVGVVVRIMAADESFG